MSEAGGSEFARRCEELFMALLPLDPALRAERLAQACGSDAALRAEVESLLRHHDGSDGLLDRPAPFSFGGAALHGGEEEAALPPQPEAGGYRLRSVLGSGGMGVVYVAEQRSTRRTVAVKVIRRGAASASVARRFEHEAAILAKLQHAGIAQIFEAGVADFGHGPQSFIAMELVDGLPLSDYADSHGLDVAGRLELLARVADAVHHAHQRGVIHRDLKPANILVVHGAEGDAAPVVGQPKILDFGVARATDGESSPTSMRTSVGQLVGTLPYMSPEQVSGEPAEIDIRSDVYSLGVLLYRLLAGRLPHDLAGCSIAEAARIIRDDPPKRLSAIHRLLRGDIESIVRKALEKDKEQRYPSAAELAADLRRHLANEPIAARPATAVYHIRKFIRRNRALTGAIAALFLVVGVGTVTTIVLGVQAIVAGNAARLAQGKAEDESREAARQADIARRTAYRANIAAAASATNARDVLTARRHLEAIEESERTNFEWRYLDAQQDDALAVLRAPGSAVYGVAYSPDGTLLASGSWDGAIRLWDTRTDELVAVLTGHERPVYSVAFDPSGGSLVSASTDKSVRVWDVATRSQRLVCLGHQGPVHAAAFSPDGTMIASASEDGTLRWWDASTGAALPNLTKESVPMRGLSISPDGRQVAAACADGHLRVWPVSDPTPLVDRPAHTSMLLDVRYSPDGRRLASAGQDEIVRLWDTADWRSLLVIEAGSGRIDSIAFRPDGAALATGSEDMTVRIWDTAEGRAVAALTGHIGPVAAVAWSPDGRRLASASTDALGSVRVWDPTTRDGPQFLDRLGGSIASIGFSADGTILSAVSVDREVRQWDTASGLRIAKATEWRQPATTSRVRTDGRWLLLLNQQLAVLRVDLGTWEERRVQGFAPGSELPASLAGTADGRFLAATTGKGRVEVLDLETGASVGVLTGDSDRVTAVEFSLDQRRLASADETGRVRLWEAPGGPLIRELQSVASGDPANPTTRLAFSHDGSMVAAFGYSDAADVWDTTTGAHSVALKGHAGGVRGLAFSPDGSRIATGSGDGVIRLWESATGREIMALRSSRYPVTALAFSPDGSMLAIGSHDRTVRVLRATPAPDVARACDEMTRLARDGRLRAGAGGATLEARRAIAAREDLSALERRAALLALLEAEQADADRSGRAPSPPDGE